MQLPRFRVRTLMIAVVVVGASIAIAINVRRSITPATMTLTVINETGTDVLLDRISCQTGNGATMKLWGAMVLRKVGPGMFVLPKLHDSGRCHVQVFGHLASGPAFSGAAQVTLVGGSRSRVHCRVVRSDAGAAAELWADGPPVDMVAPLDYGTTLLALAVFAAPVIVFLGAVAEAVALMTKNGAYATHLRKSHNGLEVCPWPPDSPGEYQR